MSPLAPATVSALPARPALPAGTQAAGALLLLLAALPAAAAPCATLSGLELPETTIRSAVVVPAGAFTPPGMDAAATLPAFCRVVGVTRPAVTFEVWLPLDDWNGKFHVSGNGGMAGVISYGAMAGALRRGYAAASTDTGHVRPGTGGFDASWALGRPDLIEDFDPAALTCPDGEDHDGCLTPPQVQAVRSIRAGSRDYRRRIGARLTP